MLTIETKELEISLKPKRKVETICKFACAKPTFTNENIKSIKETNIAYVMPHIIKVNSINYLMFDECDDIFIDGYDEKIKFKDFNLFNKKEIEKATKHINNEMYEYARDFYNDKEDNEKDDGFEL